MILEELEHARQRDARIFAEVAGFGSSQDTFDPALPDPEGKAYAAACGAALREAKAEPADVDAIFPHALGIPHHDASELTGMRVVFGDDLPNVALCPVKHATGCTAAGTAIDLAVGALSIHHGVLPPVPEGASATVQMSRRRSENVGVALASTFGMGGQNAAVVLRKMET